MDEQAVVYEDVTSTQPTVDAPITETPVVDAPITETPVVDTPTIDTSQTPAGLVDGAINYIEETRTENISTDPTNYVDQWIKNEYNYNPNDRGSKWIAGKINDVKTQMGFLQALVNEQMYTEMDLQKYYFDQNLAIARAYAKEKKTEVAYGYYKAAQEKALSEGQLTGWYMPPEGAYLLNQWEIAKDNFNSNDPYERARAQRVSKTAEAWFANNNITVRGIETLSSLSLKETIRHNKVMEALQEQANKIAAAGVATQKAAQNLALRESDFDLAQLELAKGLDLDKDGVIGFKGKQSYLGQFADKYEWATNNFAEAQQQLGVNVMRQILGDNYKTIKTESDALIKAKQIQESIKENGKIDPSLYKKTDIKVITSDKKGEQEVYTLTVREDNGQITTRAFVQSEGDFKVLPINTKVVGGGDLKDKVDSTLIDSNISLGEEKFKFNKYLNIRKEIKTARPKSDFFTELKQDSFGEFVPLESLKKKKRADEVLYYTKREKEKKK